MVSKLCITMRTTSLVPVGRWRRVLPRRGMQNTEIDLAWEPCRGIDLSCRACGVGAGCWAWNPGRRTFSVHPKPPTHAKEPINVNYWSGQCCDLSDVVQLQLRPEVALGNSQQATPQHTSKQGSRSMSVLVSHCSSKSVR